MRRRFPLPNLTIICLLFMIAGYAEFVGSMHQVLLRLHVLPQIMRWSPFPTISKRRKRIFRCRPDEIPHTKNKKRRGYLYVYGHTHVVVDIHAYILPRFRERNKQFHTGPELSDGNSADLLALVQVNALSELNPSEAIVHSLPLPLPQQLARPCRCSQQLSTGRRGSPPFARSGSRNLTRERRKEKKSRPTPLSLPKGAQRTAGSIRRSARRHQNPQDLTLRWCPCSPIRNVRPIAGDRSLFGCRNI